jgi:hypothetical protein
MRNNNNQQIFNHSPPELHNHNGFPPIPPPQKQNMNFHNNFLNNKESSSIFSRIGSGQLPPPGNFQLNQSPPMINPFNPMEFKGNIPSNFVNNNGSFKGKTPVFPPMGMPNKNGDFLNALKNPEII